ncbi:MAG: hypothetical protein JXQ73_29695 [Phycisphaerae bacterium]|nr:hypothetical protein [Phycisphaerae bacterium]
MTDRNGDVEMQGYSSDATPPPTQAQCLTGCPRGERWCVCKPYPLGRLLRRGALLRYGWLPFLTLFVLPRSGLGDATIELRAAKLTLDDQGRIRLFESADGPELTVGGLPAFSLETDGVTLRPTAVTGTTDGLVVSFEGGAAAEFRVIPDRAFVLFELRKLTATGPIQRFRLFSLPIPSGTKVVSGINAAYLGRHIISLMSAETNVRAFSSRFSGQLGDKPGCTHRFERTDTDARVGRCAARFAATSKRQDNGGWSLRGRTFPRPMDLSGCKAIRAWVHGDGNGELLKIQLQGDGQGYRDNYVKIDFEGWRRLTLADNAIDTIRYDRVRHLNFYYNGLPGGKTVTCLIDHVEAVLERDGKETAVVLEDFESSDSPLWDGGSVMLAVETYQRHGVEPARFGLIVCPRDEFPQTVARFEEVAGLPSPHPGGVWSKTSPWVKRSYLFITGFSEAQTEDALKLARRGGFHTILILGGSWHESTGHYRVNRKNFPDGLESLQRTVNRFKDAGFKVGLHFLGASIYPPDPYLVPVPDKRLVKGASTVLAVDVDEKVELIPTSKPPLEFPTEDGGYGGNGTVLWIGDELIQYAALSTKPPYGFRGCRRGHLGTHPAPHRGNARIDHLARSYGYHMYDMDTTLLDEVAANFARVANACNVDMLYFDGSERLQGDHWYYNARLHKAFYDRLNNKDTFLQASSFSHYSWHMMARSASADGHGDLKGYLDARSPWFDALARDFMPLDIGWYYGYDPMATPDMFEYVLAATIAYDSSMSFQVSVDAAKRHPFTGTILDLIARYERLRLSGRVPQVMRDRLRIDPKLGASMEPEERAARADQRREYRLLGREGAECFQRVIYSPWKEVLAIDGKSNVFDVKIEQGPAPIGMQIHAMPGPWLQPEPAYHAADAFVLESFDDLAAYARSPKAGGGVYRVGPGEGGSTLDGVTQHLESSDQDAREGKRCAVYTATSSRPSSDGWSVIGKTFDAPLDLSWHKAIGLWMRGDGKGGRFKVQLRDAGKGVQDYYITNDYVGWRYQRLARPEKDGLDYTRVASLTLYYNGLPAKTTVFCGLDDIKALRRFGEPALINPRFDVAGKRMTWKGSLTTGQYLFFDPDGSVTRYGPGLGDGESLPSRSEKVSLQSGQHRILLGCEGPLVMPIRVRAVYYAPERYPVR